MIPKKENISFYKYASAFVQESTAKNYEKGVVWLDGQSECLYQNNSLRNR